MERQELVEKLRERATNPRGRNEPATADLLTQAADRLEETELELERLTGISSKPIPPEDLQRASEHAKERGWLMVELATGEEGR